MKKNHYKNNAALLADARRSLLGHLKVVIWSFLLYIMINLFLNGLPASISFQSRALTLTVFFAAQFVMSVFISLFNVGLSAVFLNLQYGENARIGDLMVCFGRFQDTSVKVRSVVTLGEFLTLIPLQLLLNTLPEGSVRTHVPLILVIGVLCFGARIFWQISFAMTDYLLLDFPEMGARRILYTARSMMRRNRMRFFLLMLRIVPLHLLGALCFGLTELWTGSYQRAASAAFYKDMISAAASRAREQ